MAIEKLNKADLKILERIFAAEIADHLPAQLKSKHLPRLQEEGLIEPATRTLGGRFPVTVSGWALTPRGHMLYCMSCGDEPEPSDVPARDAGAQ